MLVGDRADHFCAEHNMKNETFEGTVEEYQGERLKTPIKYSGTVEIFTNPAEVREAGLWPNDADIVDTINARRITAAKAKEYQAQTKSLKEAYESSPAFKRANLLKALVGAGKSQADAEGIIESMGL